MHFDRKDQDAFQEKHDLVYCWECGEECAKRLQDCVQDYDAWNNSFQLTKNDVERYIFLSILITWKWLV